MVDWFRGEGFGTRRGRFGELFGQPITAQRPAAQAVSGEGGVQLVTLDASPIILRDTQPWSRPCVCTREIVYLSYSLRDLRVFIKGVFVLSLEDGDLIHLGAKSFMTIW